VKWVSGFWVDLYRLQLCRNYYIIILFKKKDKAKLNEKILYILRFFCTPYFCIISPSAYIQIPFFLTYSVPFFWIFLFKINSSLKPYLLFPHVKPLKLIYWILQQHFQLKVISIPNVCCNHIRPCSFRD
jgi:hypothetical protein